MANTKVGEISFISGSFSNDEGRPMKGGFFLVA